ncbi:MAG: hypothetical protein KatS3mg033_0293 [Thermonema sp.]|nr:MAG: hypothetical protein KatS3mg033_0293 [Thermonema sp.]
MGPLIKYLSCNFSRSNLLIILIFVQTTFCVWAQNREVNTDLQLTFMCYDAGADRFLWRVRNENTQDVPYTWVIEGSDLSGSGVAVPGDNFFYTTRTGVGCDLLILYVKGKEQDKGRKCADTTQLCESSPQECLECGETLGGDGFPESWSKAEITAKALEASTFMEDAVFFTGNTVRGPGVGVAGPEGTAQRLQQINYIPGYGTEVLRFRFCRDEGFRHMKVTLSHIYREYGKVEQGYWIARDAQGQEVGRGYFAAEQYLGNGNPGFLQIEVHTDEPFYYLDFHAGPYGEENMRQYEDASDYYVREITPLCQPEPECLDTLGGTTQDWRAASIEVRGLYDSTYQSMPPEAIRPDWQNLPLSGGVGVPGPVQGQQAERSRFHEINYIAAEGRSEYLRVDFRKDFPSAQVTLSRFYGHESQNKAERATWVAYRREGNALIEVGRGMVRGVEPWCYNCAGLYTFYIQTTEPFSVLEFSAEPYVAASKGVPADDSDFLVHEIIPCATPPDLCQDECVTAMRVVAFEQGKRKNGSAVLANRSHPERALGEPERSDAMTNANEHNFVSLGFGGSLTLELSCRVCDKEGYDLELFETSFGNPKHERYPEKAELFVSADGVYWVSLGETQPGKERPENSDGSPDANGARFDLAESGLSCVKYVKIVDRTDPNISRFPRSADGFDVDGIRCAAERGDEPPPPPPTYYRSAAAFEENVLQRQGNRWVVNLYEASELPLSEHTQVRMYNSVGRLVWQAAFEGEQAMYFEIDMQRMQPGIYILRIETPDMQKAVKILR